MTASSSSCLPAPAAAADEELLPVAAAAVVDLARLAARALFTEEERFAFAAAAFSFRSALTAERRSVPFLRAECTRACPHPRSRCDERK